MDDAEVYLADSVRVVVDDRDDGVSGRLPILEEQTRLLVDLPEKPTFVVGICTGRVAVVRVDVAADAEGPSVVQTRLARLLGPPVVQDEAVSLKDAVRDELLVLRVLF